MPPSALRAAQDSCRWRPTQEGVAWLATKATKRKLLFSAAALLNLVTNRSMEYAALRGLQKSGDISGLDEISSGESFLAGGLLVGYMVEPSKEPDGERCGKSPRTSNSNDNSWSWIACMALSNQILVYANDTTTWHIRDHLVAQHA